MHNDDIYFILNTVKTYTKYLFSLTSHNIYIIIFVNVVSYGLDWNNEPAVIDELHLAVEFNWTISAVTW